MAGSINGTTITLTRGDSYVVDVHIYDRDTGEEYTPQEGEIVRFKMVKKYPATHGDGVALIEKVLDNEALTITFDPEDTIGLKFGEYKYDIQLTKPSGAVDTFIDKASFIVSEEVD